jgi:hypothetical protein
MSKLHELKIDQKLYGVEYRINQRIIPYDCRVTELKKTVFSAYSDAFSRRSTTFRLKDLYHKEWNGYRLFITEQERDEFIMMCERQNRMANTLTEYGKYTTEQLDRIDAILIENIIKS